MAEKKKTPQNGERTAAPPTEQGDKEHVLHIDTENDMLYFIDDDGERVDITKANVMTDEDRERLHNATDKLFAGITFLSLDTSVAVPKFSLPKIDLPNVNKMAKNATAGATLIKEAIKEAGLLFFTQEFKDLLQELRDNLQPLQDLFSEIEELEPYLKAELNKDKYDGKTLDFVMNNYTPGETLELRRDPTSFFAIAMEAARAARDTALLSEPYKAEKMLLPTDKLNLFAWDMKETNGQIQFNLSRGGNDGGATALFSLTFDDDPNVKLTKEIDHFDKAVVSAVGTAYNSGTTIISATGIYYAIGGTGKPDATTIERINKSLTKLDMGKVYIDNTEEAKLYNYERLQKEDRLLHFKRVTAIANGKVSDAFIQILEEPILMTFARQRKQISAVPIKVLQAPVSKTNNHLKVQDYLLWRIVQRRRELNKLKEQQQKKYTQNRQRDIKEKAKLTIALKTFYEHTGNSRKDSTAKKRARSTAEKYLQHYQSDAAGNWIERYTIDKENIIIYLPIK